MLPTIPHTAGTAAASPACMGDRPRATSISGSQLRSLDAEEPGEPDGDDQPYPSHLGHVPHRCDEAGTMDGGQTLNRLGSCETHDGDDGVHRRVAAQGDAPVPHRVDEHHRGGKANSTT